ncbi:MAG: hypothetical protein LBC37_05960 [Zoogloeaceae bacterium]|nr:hypothetical protein [Zoogloeaceae bacterium]
MSSSLPEASRALSVTRPVFPEPGALPGGRIPLPPFIVTATEMSEPK